MESHRTERVSEALKEELSEIIGYEMSDPRIGMATVSEVHLSPDKRHAVVRVSLSGEPKAREVALRALEGARPYLRRELSARLRLFRTPELHFEVEPDEEVVGRVETLLKRARKSLRKSEPSPQE